MSTTSNNHKKNHAEEADSKNKTTYTNNTTSTNKNAHDSTHGSHDKESVDKRKDSSSHHSDESDHNKKNSKQNYASDNQYTSHEQQSSDEEKALQHVYRSGRFFKNKGHSEQDAQEFAQLLSVTFKAAYQVSGSSEDHSNKLSNNSSADYSDSAKSAKHNATSK